MTRARRPTSIPKSTRKKVKESVALRAPDLFRAYQRFVAEEVVSALRHPLINHFSGVGTASSYLKRRARDSWLVTEPDLETFFEMISRQVAEGAQVLQRRFLHDVAPSSVPVLATCRALLVATPYASPVTL